MSEKPSQRVCIGRLSRPHGLRGEIKALLEVDDLETVRALQTVEVEGLPYRLASVRMQNNFFLLSLEGVTTREAAQSLAGRDIWIDPAQLPPLPAGEYYQFEIIGLAAYVAESLTRIGEVTAILPTPAHDIYVIQGAGQEYLVPAVAAAIVSLEPENGRLLIAAAYLTVANGVH